MAEITFITGGCRSGKSRFALQRGEALPGPRAFLATCPVLDDEMQRRVEAHRRERAGRGWDTLEEPLRLERLLSRPSPHRVLLLDCLSLWINNLLHEAGTAGVELGEAHIEALCRSLVKSCSDRTVHLIVVSNEVGMGIVPENALARQYRDLLGRANQVLAESADTVHFLVSGIPLTLKGSS